MSIITDALKKAQKERLPAPSPREKNITAGPGPSAPKPKAAAKALSGPMVYAVIAAVLSLMIIAVYIVTLLYSSRPEAAAVNENALKPAAARHTAPAKPEPRPAVKIEPFSITIPRIAPPAAAPVKTYPDLTGIMYLPTSPQAVLNGRTVKEGDVVDGYTVIKIYPESVKISSDGVEAELKLR